MTRFRSFHVLLCFVFLGSLLPQLSAAEPDATAEFQKSIKPLLTTYCVRCHGQDEQNGERRFDKLTGKITDDNSVVDYQDILDQLNLGEMPPADEKQPTIQERRRLISWLTENIKTYHTSHKSRSAETVLRRLNAREYRNTIRDLFQLNTTIFDPTTSFPKDRTTDHLDNVGSTLVTSGYLLARYLDAAEHVVDKAMFPAEKPEIQTWTFKDHFRQQPEIDQVHRKTSKFEYLILYDVRGADKHEGAYAPIHAFAEGVPCDGYYEIRLKAEAVNRENPYDPEFLGTDPSEPLRLGIVPGDHTVGQLHKPQPIEPMLAQIDLADEVKWYTVRVWLDKGYTPRFTFENGLMDARTLWSRLIKKYADQFPERKRPGIVEARYNAIAYGKLPQIHIHEVEIMGPLYDEWPRASQRATLGDDWEQVVESGKISDSQIRRHLNEFLSRAYRRPATEAEVERIAQIIRLRQKQGRSAVEAYSDGLKAALTSPNFLYLEEPGGKQLSPYGLASRLSYFLWSSMPDDELLRLAENGKILQDEEILRQVDRMLNDPKSEAFIDGFLGSWLTLHDLGASPPDRGDFREFYHYDLGHAMREETRLFTRYLIDENLSVLNFLDSDFTFVNKRLAKHYGLDAQFDDFFTFKKVPLKDKRRGGLIGQASILTVTANGIDTSPVVRGVWLLENLLGTPPNPPPPDVEPLDPDIRGAKTIRDQLQKHRSNPACYDCHRKIDPLGFALENFDPVGGWRTSYGRNKPIDASGELANGKEFHDVTEFKQLLLEKPDTFLRGLTEKLLSYSIGRELTPSDRPSVDAITNSLKNDSDGLRDLIRNVALSDPFRTP
jgi:hypothetical protein